MHLFLICVLYALFLSLNAHDHCEGCACAPKRGATISARHHVVGTAAYYGVHPRHRLPTCLRVYSAIAACHSHLSEHFYFCFFFVFFFFFAFFLSFFFIFFLLFLSLQFCIALFAARTALARTHHVCATHGAAPSLPPTVCLHTRSRRRHFATRAGAAPKADWPHTRTETQAQPNARLALNYARTQSGGTVPQHGAESYQPGRVAILSATLNFYNFHTFGGSANTNNSTQVQHCTS